MSSQCWLLGKVSFTTSFLQIEFELRAKYVKNEDYRTLTSFSSIG